MRTLKIRLGLAGVAAAALLALLLLVPGGGGGSALAAPNPCAPATPVPIPDLGKANLDCTITQPGLIKDLNVGLLINHTFVGDLRIELTHVETGRTVVLINRPVGGVGDCPNDNIDAFLNDQAPLPVDDQCNPAPPAISGALTPSEPLSAFDGEKFAGTWRLTVLDLNGVDEGSVKGFSLFASTNLGKVPQFQNIWLCNFESAFSDNCNREADIQFVIDPTITTADPKCVGFPNFLPDAECPRQVVGGFEFEVRFDAKYVNVQLDAGYPLLVGIDDCVTTKGQGFVQIRCNTKGKDGHLTGVNRLAVAHVRATPDVYSILKANQENGIVTQLINQDCNLFDDQGHPIPLSRGNDWCADSGAITLRYLEGDVHADCLIDVHDQQQISFRWGSHLGQLLYNDNFDLEPSSPKLGDGDIDAKDLQMVFGRHDSNCKAPHPAQDPIDPKAKVEPPLNSAPA